MSIEYNGCAVSSQAMSTTPLPSQQQVNATPKHESITGVVERLTYYSQELGYTVARLQRPSAK